MNAVYWARFFHENDGRWSVDVPDMPGCLTWGHTVEEAYRYLTEEAIPCWLGKDPWPSARGPEEVLAAKRVEDLPEPILVRVEIGGPGQEALPGPLAADLARAAADGGVPVGEILARAAREYLDRHSNGRV